MERSEDREIYLERWKSVKDAKVFQKNLPRGFAQGRFQREEFKNIEERTPAYRVKQTYYNIKNVIQNTIRNTKEQGVNIGYER